MLFDLVHVDAACAGVSNGSYIAPLHEESAVGDIGVREFFDEERYAVIFTVKNQDIAWLQVAYFNGLFVALVKKNTLFYH